MHSLITYVLKVIRGWNWLCVLTPLLRDRLPHFCFTIRRKLFIFSTFSKNIYSNELLLIPLTAQPYDSCSKGLRGLKCVMRIDNPHAEPTTAFLFLNLTKIVHFFFNFFKNKLNIFKNFPDSARFSRFRLGVPTVIFFFCSFFRAHGSHAPMFFFNITKHRQAFLALWLVEKRPASCRAALIVPPCSKGHISCYRGPRGLIFFLPIRPLMGGSQRSSQKKEFDEKKCFLSY